MTMNQFNTIMFGVETGNAIGIKASMCTCNECCNKIIKFIDSISADNSNGGIIL